MESWTRGPVDLVAFLFAPGTVRLPPTPVKLDVIEVAPRPRSKTSSLQRVGGRHVVPGANQNAPRGFLATSTLSPKPRRKNSGSYIGRRQAHGAGGEGDFNFVDRGEDFVSSKPIIHHTALTAAPRVRWPLLRVAAVGADPSRMV